jgi:tRNA A37 methylthiotransferase MiaB
MCEVLEDADLILTNTCAIRENAEAKIWQRLKYFASLRKKAKKEGLRAPGYPVVGVLGCMAERLKSKLLDDSGVDFIAGPDAYRNLPNLLKAATTDQMAANTQLSLEETYADITPVRLAEGNTHAFVTITRGCNNHCAFCIVPYTRGKERSRPVESILSEIKILRDQGVKEVVLLGQNVNSYWDQSTESSLEWQQQYLEAGKPFVYSIASGFTQRTQIVSRGSGDQVRGEDNEKKGEMKMALEDKNVEQRDINEVVSNSDNELLNNISKEVDITDSSERGVRFAELLSKVAAIDPDNMRIRFQSPHPKDFPDEVLHLVAVTPNICNSLHMPAQHGNSEALERMKRGYSREAYVALVARARDIIGGDSPEGIGLGLSSDFIAGFCGETEEEHQETISLMREVGFDQAFTYSYSRREQTYAGLFLKDDVPEETKARRLTEMVDTFQSTSMQRNNRLEIGRLHLVLVEGQGKKLNIPAPSSVDGQYSLGNSSTTNCNVNIIGVSWTGRTDSNKRVVFPSSISSPVLPSLSREQAELFASLPLPLSSSSDMTVFPGVDLAEGIEAVAALVRKCNSDSYSKDNSNSDSDSLEPPPPLLGEIEKGSYVVVKILSGRGHTLRAAPIAIISSLTMAHQLNLPSLKATR